MQTTSGADLYKSASSLAHLYGFLPISHWEKMHNPARSTSKFSPPSLSMTDRKSDMCGGEVTRALELSLNNGLLSLETPHRFSLSSARTKSSKGAVKTNLAFGLHVIGVPQTIAEATVIRTSYVILSEAVKKNLCVHIHTIGDKDSSARFLRELSAFFRKNIAEFSPQIQALIRTDIWSAYVHIHTRTHPLSYECPTPMEFLNAQSRTHFQEVLEYLEASDIPYEIDSSLVGNRDCNTNTIFTIVEAAKDDDTTHTESLPCTVAGGRYDELARRLFKSPVGAVSATFIFTNIRGTPKIAEPKVATPRIFFLHIGFEASLKSLAVLDTLRNIRVPFFHALGKVPLSEHLRKAEDLGVPYLILLGQREAMEKSILLRNMSTRAQESIPMENLSTRLRALRR
jgi:histidyl-tRNA synthetase